MLIALVFSSCSPQLPTSIGKVREIVIITRYHSLIDSVTNKILQDSIETPQSEPEFLVRNETLQQLAAFAGFHLIFIIGTLKDEPVQRLLGNYRSEVENDTSKLFAISEPWAKNQKVLVLVVQNETLLTSELNKFAKRIRYTFQQWVIDQIRRITYQRGANQLLKKILLDKYGFAFDLPTGFKLVDKYEFDKFIYFLSHNPDRSIFCYYEDGMKPLNKGNLLTFRDILTAQFYDGDFVIKDFTHADTVRFLDVLALKMTGVWQNNRLVAGGPFVSYCFNYQNRFYFIDGMAFNPGKYKLDNQNQLNVILQTFSMR